MTTWIHSSSCLLYHGLSNLYETINITHNFSDFTRFATQKKNLKKCYCSVFTWTRTREHVTIHQSLPDNRQSRLPHSTWWSNTDSPCLDNYYAKHPDGGARETLHFHSLQLSHDKHVIDLPSIRLIFMLRMLSPINIKLSLYLKDRLSSTLLINQFTDKDVSITKADI